MRIFLLFFYLFCFTANAQQVTSFNLYFETDNFVLSQTIKQKIDSTIKTLTNIQKGYKITIAGHTDNEGDLEYNKNLSLKRANAVKEHFFVNGFLQKDISCNAYAFVKPIGNNKNDDGKAKNRRVTVTISAKMPELSKLFVSDNKTKTVSILADSGGNFKYNSGSEIIIPPNAFETLDGKKVEGKVKVEYTEYRSQVDFLASGIPMSFFNENNELVQFNSGGMFNIKALQDNKELKLKQGADIKVNFIKTQSLPDMRFFSFDTAHNAWTADKQKLTNRYKAKIWVATKAGANGKPLDIFVKKINGKDSCLLYPCLGAFFSIRKGLEIASSDKAINFSRPYISFTNKEHHGNRSETYNLKIVSSSKNRVEFKITSNQKKSVYDVFKDYNWVYGANKDHPFKNKWEKEVWLRVKVDYLTGNDFNLTLYSNSEKISFLVEAKTKNKGFGTAELDKLHQDNKNINLDAFLKQNSDFIEFEELANSEDKNCVRYCSDSLTCFYQYNRQWMDESTGETGLTKLQWFDYFNANKNLMKARYLKLQMDENVITPACIAQEKKRIEQERVKKEMEVQNRRLKEVADSLSFFSGDEQLGILNKQFESLSIKNLGVWNCDQVQRLKEPVYVIKKYKDEKGKPIEPIIIFIIDKQVSGTLTYNGYRDLSPYYFPVSSKSENTLIAFDINNKAYICDSDKFSNFVKEKDGSQIILSPLKNANEQIPSFN